MRIRNARLMELTLETLILIGARERTRFNSVIKLRQVEILILTPVGYMKTNIRQGKIKLVKTLILVDDKYIERIRFTTLINLRLRRNANLDTCI